MIATKDLASLGRLLKDPYASLPLDRLADPAIMKLKFISPPKNASNPVKAPKIRPKGRPVRRI